MKIWKRILKSSNLWGDEFGYTGTTSPMLAYARSIEENELQIGDYVVFWTVGAGTTCATVLYKY